MSYHQGDNISLIFDAFESDEPTSPYQVSVSSPDRASDRGWTSSPQEGRLAIDVYDAGDHIVILAPMAGVDPSGVDISLHGDMLSIRGMRTKPPLTETCTGQYHAECYWGAFSRSIVLPVDVASAAASAEYVHGLLTIRIPKAQTSKGRSIPIEIVEE